MSGDESESESIQNLRPKSSKSTPGSWFLGSRFAARRRPASIDVARGQSGSNANSAQTSPLLSNSALPFGSNHTAHNDYGTLPRASSSFFRGRRSSQQREVPISPPGGGGGGGITPISPGLLSRQSSTSIFQPFSRRPKSTYDRVLEQAADSDEINYINGIRFYYSTFTSIDWLHDAIKDSTRIIGLRRRRSLRGKLVNLADRSLGWFVVSIVGFLTAIVAFGIVRLEQWLFDIKEGACTDGWWKAKRFCCPVLGPDISMLENFSTTSLNGVFRQSSANASALVGSMAAGGNSQVFLPCAEWVSWAERFDPEGGLGEWFVEYAVYTFFALLLAFGSAILTIKLTASTSFVASTDSPASVFLNDSMAKSGPGGELEASDAPKRKILYFASGSGIPELKCILGGFVMRGYLGGRTLFTKSIALPMSVASGLTLGKEGPFVHIASCLGNIVSRWFVKYETNEAKRREILSAAAAAGVAVAFGAPVGGVLFSLEEVSYFFPAKVLWRSFFCAMIAAATLRFLDPFGTGKVVLFQVTYDKDWHAFELWFFVLLGLLGGLYGGYSTMAHVWWVKNVRKLKWVQTHPISEVMLITLLTTLLCFLNPYTRMGGTELVYNLFAECHEGDWHEGLCVSRTTPVMPVVSAIAVAGLIKAVLVAITFGIKVPAGIFIPTLGVGACAGRIVGLYVQYLEHHHPEYSMFDVCKSNGSKDCVIPGLYAMIGAAAALSGTTRTTISLAVIVFELTRTMNYVVPVMISVLVAKTVADFIQPTGLYDCVIEMNQLPYLERKHEYLWGSHTLADVTNTRGDWIRADMDTTVGMLQDKLRHSEEEDNGFPVVAKADGPGGQYKCLGYIGNNELQHALTIVEEDPSAVCRFYESYPHHSRDMTASYSSLLDGGAERDPYDFTVYMDSSPVTVNSNSPLELVHQIFTKLGARYIVVNNLDGYYEGIIDKKMWIAFVSDVPSA